MSGDLVDFGPRDHGAVFDFDFPTLAPGATVTFRTFYGAAGTEAAALSAVTAAGAEVYSFGQSSRDGGDHGTPNTFIFGFTGVGGVPVGSALATSTTVASNSNPSLVGTAVTFSAVVTPESGATAPVGTVSFRNGISTLGTVAVTPGAGNTAVASFTTSALSAGTHSISAAYSGGSTGAGASLVTFRTSESSPLSQVVTLPASTTGVTSSANPSDLTQPVTLTATVRLTAAGTPVSGGTVTFKDGVTNISGAITVVSGQASMTTPTLGAGAHDITADFSGSSTAAASSGGLTQTVKKAPSAVKLDPTVAITYGQNATFRAVVTGLPAFTAPTGSVEFSIDGSVVATVPLTGGVATFTATGLPAGSRGVEALYTGNASYLPGSATATQIVNKATPTITWLAPAAIVYGTALSGIQLNATANQAGTFAYTPAAGDVPEAGSRTLNVTFAPLDVDNFNNAAASVTLVVNKATPSVVVNGVTVVYDGAAHPATGTVTGVAGADLGSPSFTYDGGSDAPVNAGTYAVVGSFAGNSNYEPASGSGTIVINKATPTVTVSGGTFTYTTEAYPSTGSVKGVGGVDLGAPTITYNGEAAAPVNAGSYAVLGSFAGNANYAAARGTATVNINKAAPDGQRHRRYLRL